MRRMNITQRAGLALLAWSWLSPATLGQDGTPLPRLGGDLQGQAPQNGNQNWPDIQAPANNPFVPSTNNPFFPRPGTNTDARRVLGKALFWEEQVSSDNTMACGTCHAPAFGGIDMRLTFPSPIGTEGSLGMVPQDSGNRFMPEAQLVQDRRVTPLAPASTVTGAAFKTSSFWDGRMGPSFLASDGSVLLDNWAALEAQAVLPPVNSIEMCRDGFTWNAGTSTDSVAGKLGPARPLALATDLPQDLLDLQADYATYAEAFDATFAGTPYAGPDGVTRERFAMAIATYERTLVPNQAPIDLLDIDALDMAAVDASPKRGFELFVSSDCDQCHSDANTGRSPMPFGLKPGGGFTNPFDSLLSDGLRRNDVGVPGTTAFESSVGTEEATGVVTPSLRNVALKRRFFHNGSLDSLEDVIRFYNGEIPGSAPNYRFFPALQTEQDHKDVRAFFETLTDPRVANGDPPFDRPTLYSERVPHGSNEYGNPTPVTGPELIANSPLLDGDMHFKIGLKDAPISSAGFLGVSTTPASGPLVWIGSAGLSLIPITTDANGLATYAVGPLPAGLTGLTVYAQAWVAGQFSGAAEWTFH